MLKEISHNFGKGLLSSSFFRLAYNVLQRSPFKNVWYPIQQQLEG